MKGSIGLAKVKYSSSVGFIPQEWNGNPSDLTLALTERLNRKKASGLWPSKAIQSMIQQFNLSVDDLEIAENRDVEHPKDYESLLNSQMPFDEYLTNNGLSAFSSRFNKRLQYFPHHYSHALVAELMSPFKKAMIVVIDGAGSRLKDIPKEHLIGSTQDLNQLEECSFYLLDKNKPETLTLVQKDWQCFNKGVQYTQHEWSQGLGMLYERIAEYIFNSNQAAGKVMGLASFGQPELIDDRVQFLDALDWSKRYNGSSIESWLEWCETVNAQNLAATVQQDFERDLMNRIKLMRQRFPDYEDLILVGGCALNCTFNWKLLATGLARQLYVPPFPGDAGIGLGLAFGLYKKANPTHNVHISHEEQLTAYGLANLENIENSIKSLFCDYTISATRGEMSLIVNKLKKGEVIAWFSGRSESGPRALGHRSLLALPAKRGLKDYINRHIKFREEFRPYGCSVLHSCAHEYFAVNKGFHNPFMSFAIPVSKDWSEYLSEVSHIDGTSRMQTVHQGQNPEFFQLLQEIQKNQIPPIVLNTSLNVMGEPIVETLSDLKRFMDESIITCAFVDGYLIEKKR
jgi:carbamoyltransferase